MGQIDPNMGGWSINLSVFLGSPRDLGFLKGFDSSLQPVSTAPGNLVITRASGGRWRFDLKLEATEPEVGDPLDILDL